LAISKEEKKRRVAIYKEELNSSEGVIFTDYRGLSTPQMTELRAQLKETGASFMVVKNTLVRIALQELGKTVPDELLIGPVAISFCHGDVVQTAKKLFSFYEEYRLPVIKGALLGDSLLSPTEVERLAKLPPRDELLAQLMSNLQAPLYGLVNVLSGVIRSLLYVLQARAQQLEQA